MLAFIGAFLNAAKLNSWFIHDTHPYVWENLFSSCLKDFATKNYQLNTQHSRVSQDTVSSSLILWFYLYNVVDTILIPTTYKKNAIWMLSFFFGLVILLKLYENDEDDQEILRRRRQRMNEWIEYKKTF